MSSHMHLSHWGRKCGNAVVDMDVIAELFDSFFSIDSLLLLCSGICHLPLVLSHIMSLEKLIIK